MKRKCAVKTAGSLLLAGALAFTPQGSFLGNKGSTGRGNG